MRIFITAASVLFGSISDRSGFVTIPSKRNQYHHYRDSRGIRSKKNDHDGSSWCSRKEVLSKSFLFLSSLSTPLLSHISNAQAKIVSGGGTLYPVHHPETYPALVYVPKLPTTTPTMDDEPQHKLPVLIVLHGAGKNELDISNLSNIQGEHSGLAPSLLASGKAPSELTDHFIVIAPYSQGTTSFYNEPRSKLLRFIRWACDDNDDGMESAKKQGIPTGVMDLSRRFLFGFSDGATLGVELMTTRLFQGGIFAAYGFTGRLPPLALEKLQGLPMWMFHSKDDVIFPVECSDRLVEDLRNSNASRDIIRYTRFDTDQEGFTGSVRGHSTGITASKDPEIYRWMLSL